MMGLLPPCAPRDHVEGHHEATVTSDGRTSTSLRSEYNVQYVDNGESEGKNMEKANESWDSTGFRRIIIHILEFYRMRR